MNSSFVINGYRYDFRYRVSTSLKELVGWLVDIPGVTATGADLDELTERFRTIVKSIHDAKDAANEAAIDAFHQKLP